MRYLCLVFDDEAMLQALPGHRRRALEAEHRAGADALGRNGVCIAADRLAPAGSAAIVRLRAGKLSIGAGPVATTPEPLGGYLLIEARDLNDAIRVVSQLPAARTGRIEVRPVRAIADDTD